MENSIIKSLTYERVKDTNDQYHSHDSISASGIKVMKKSPAHFKFQEKPDTDALRFGSMYHHFILEQETFLNNYTVVDLRDRPDPKYGMTAKKNVEWFNGFNNPITMDQYVQIKEMKDVLWKHPYARSLLSGGEVETSYYCKADIGSEKPIDIRIRPDMIKHNKRIIVDLKTAQDASAYEFPRAAAKFDYHIQAAFYSDILELITGNDLGFKFFFVAQEKVKPYAFNIFEASPQMMSIGRYEYEILLMLYAWCLENDTYPGYQVFCPNKYGINELTLPPYAIKEMEFFTDHISVKSKK